MSVPGPRDAILAAKRHELAACLGSRKRKLRSLYRITTCCAATLHAGHQPRLDDFAPADPDDNEARFLDRNNLLEGKRFNEATLPYITFDDDHPPPLPTTLPFQLPAKSALARLPASSPSPALRTPSLEDQLRAASSSPAVASQPLPPGRTPPLQNTTAHAHRAKGFSHSALSAVHGPPTSTHRPDGNAALDHPSQAPAVQHVEFRSAECVTSDDVMPVKHVVTTSLPSRPSSAGTTDSKSRPPRVVHRPSHEAQDAGLQETQRKLDKLAEKERKEDEAATHPPTNGAADISSPSSTVGPYSQATPHAAHHSPDTSPDTEAYHDRNLARLGDDDALDPAAQQVKEDHERALQKQLKEAHDRARAREEDSPTPEIEKQIEDEQAIRLARDGKHQLGGIRSAANAQSIANGAEEVVPTAQVATEEVTAHRKAHDPVADSLPTPTTVAPEPLNMGNPHTDVTGSGVDAAAPDHPTPPADTDTKMNDAHPRALSNTSPQPPPKPERMTTRVSSGAMRQKSVSEIIGETIAPKSMLTPRSSNVSASISPRRLKNNDTKSQQVSTVVFAKKTPTRSSKALQSYNEDYASLQGASEDSSRDYLEGLFKYQAHHSPRSVPLQELVASARKTVTTAGTLAMIREHQDYKILKRVYQLQNANRWSLRQLQKAIEPERPFTHQDQLLLEMKWMQTDFREERKWKRTLAATFAEWCAEYVNSPPAERISLQVNAYVPQSARHNGNEDEDMHDAPTPDLVHTGPHEIETESYADDELLTPLNANPPTGLFSLGFNDVVMNIKRTPASDTVFRELPFYEPMLENSSDMNPFSLSEPPILPVSKFVTGKLVSQIRGPPRKRSRYDYDSEDEPSSPPSRSGTSAEHSMPSTPGRRLFCRNDLPPETMDVALFNAENKHVRDRLQAAHQFRPPTEFNMPSVAFFEHRTPSQWLWEEDQKLRALVKEYTFNWSLVSQQLSLPSQFVSGSGRRTPWECFERWVQLEGLPAEMSKTQYFRTYQGRLEQANKTVYAQYQAQQQQQQQQGQTAGQPRRRPTTTPIRVERRRENRHLAIIDGMRKLARKRESAAHKQAESQKAAALRKAHEQAPPKSNVHTPQEFSRLKWEREERMKQRQIQQEFLVRSKLAAQQRQAAMQAQPGMANGMNQMPRNGAAGNTNLPAQIGNVSSQQGPAGSAMAGRSHQTQQGMQANFANGNMGGMAMGTPGVPQAQMQSNMQSVQRMGPPDQMRMAMQRGQLQNANQQHQFQLQQQQINMAGNHAPGMSINSMPNAPMMAPVPTPGFNGSMNGTMNTSMNGMASNAGSPRMIGNTNMQQTSSRPLSNGHMPQLLQYQNQVKVQHPDWSPEQIHKVASDYLSRFLAKQRTQAMNAAAGSSGMNSSVQNGNHSYMPQQQQQQQQQQSQPQPQHGSMTNSSQPTAVQTYQQQLVQQQRMLSQQQRQQAGSPVVNPHPPSRSATPQNPQMQPSPGLPQAHVNRS